MGPLNRKALDAIKRDYLQGKGSLPTLCANFHFPLRTAARYCAREGWIKGKTDARKAGTEVGIALQKVGTELALKAVSREAGELARLATRFVRDSVSDVSRYQTQAASMLGQKGLSAASFRQLIAGWRDILSTGREFFGLNQAQAPQHPMLLVQSLQTAVKIMPVDHAVIELRPDIDALPSPTGCDKSSDQVDAPDASTAPAEPGEPEERGGS